MSLEHDLVIRGGTVVDGSGGAPYKADVAISDGMIRQVGTVDGRGRQEVDATGRIVTPGFVDIHTHYDAQVAWSQRLAPSTNHGVTTVVAGNCGVGFAPCRPSQRTALVTLMEGVEDIPEPVMTEGLPWDWTTFPEYLDFLARRSFDADVACYIPHAAIRVFVMGERALSGDAPSADELKQMTALVAEAMRAGAIGVSTSRSLMHQGSDGRLAPHVKSDRGELLALAEGMRQVGTGVFQIIPSLLDPTLRNRVGKTAEDGLAAYIRDELGMLAEIAKAAGRPVTFSLMDVDWSPELYSIVLEETDRRIRTEGVQLWPQVFPRPIGVLVGLELTVQPFKFHPTYMAIRHLPLAERVAELRKPEVRARLLSEEMDRAAAGVKGPVHMAFAINGYKLGDPPVYTLEAERSLIAEAKRLGVSPHEVALDWMLEKDGKAIYIAPAGNLSSPTLEPVLDMLRDPNTLIGLGDGGAHYGTICDAGYPTTLLSYWARDRKGDRGLPLEQAIEMLTSRNAAAIGFDDRGLIAPGKRADINVIDMDRLDAAMPEIVHDLPADGRRIAQRAEGYVATYVKGVCTQAEGEPTGRYPGRLWKGAGAAAMV